MQTDKTKSYKSDTKYYFQAINSTDYVLEMELTLLGYEPVLVSGSPAVLAAAIESYVIEDAQKKCNTFSLSTTPMIFQARLSQMAGSVLPLSRDSELRCTRKKSSRPLFS